MVQLLTLPGIKEDPNAEARVTGIRMVIPRYVELYLDLGLIEVTVADLVRQIKADAAACN